MNQKCYRATQNDGICREDWYRSTSHRCVTVKVRYVSRRIDPHHNRPSTSRSNCSKTFCDSTRPGFVTPGDFESGQKKRLTFHVRTTIVRLFHVTGEFEKERPANYFNAHDGLFLRLEAGLIASGFERVE